MLHNATIAAAAIATAEAIIAPLNNYNPARQDRKGYYAAIALLFGLRADEAAKYSGVFLPIGAPINADKLGVGYHGGSSGAWSVDGLSVPCGRMSRRDAAHSRLAICKGSSMPWPAHHARSSPVLCRES